jgi:hypothetical protein
MDVFYPYRYLTYGLHLQSNFQISALLPLAEEIPLEPSRTVTFNLDESACADFDQFCTKAEIYADLDAPEAILFDRRVALYRLREGRDVTIELSPTKNLRQMQLYILGTILTVLLYQRGMLALHGSAVQVGDRAVGVIAPSGTGKSSTAAALYHQGYKLLSDDAIALEFRNGQYYVHPGYPRLKISNEVAAQLDCGEEYLVEHHPECGEVSFDATHQFAMEPLPLQQIYVLHSGEALNVETLSQRDAVFSVMTNSLPTMWLQHHNPAQFKQATDFVKQVPFYRLTRSQDLGDLPKMMDLLQAHVRESSAEEVLAAV